MRAAGWLLCGALWLAGCAATPQPASDGAAERAPDLHEAARINTDLGVAYARNGNFDLALDKLLRALQQNAQYAPAHSAIAYVYQERREADKADQHYQRALQLAPGDPGTLNNFGIFLCGQKRYVEAQKMFQRAANTPRYAQPEGAFTNAGVCARQVPDLVAAEALFREALKLRPEYPEALQQLASLYFEQKDYLRARAFLQRYEKVGAPTAATLWMGAKLEAALGDRAAAAVYAERLKAQFPESDESQNLSRTPAS